MDSLIGTQDSDAGSAITRRRLIEGAVAVGASLALPGSLARAAKAEISQKRGGVLRTGHLGGGLKETLDPMKYIYSYAEPVGAQAVYDPLLYPRFAPGQVDIRPQPGLALSVTPNRDFTRWQMLLRRGVTFHNGKPFTADDVLYSFKRAINPKNGISVGAAFPDIDFNRTKKVNSHEIVFAFKSPQPNFDYNLAAQWTFRMVPSGTVSFDPPIGTGAFKFVSWRRGVVREYERNNDYWVDGLPYLDGLEVYSFSDSTARLNAFLSGQVDVIELVEAAAVKANLKNSRVRINRSQGLKAYSFFMRLDTSPFKDNRVRQAFRLATDRKRLVDQVLLGYGQVGNDLWGKGDTDYNSQLPQRDYDPERAKALLKAAGQENLRVTLLTAPGLYVAAATVFAQQARAAGLRVDLKQVPFDQYFGNQYWLKVGFQQTDWGRSFESMAVSTMRRGSPYNETAWRRPAWDKRFTQGQAYRRGSAKRRQIFNPLQKELWNEGGYIVWGYPEIIDFAAPNVRGLLRGGGQGIGLGDLRRVSLV
jgi:peptide/nickel transport system substrate-binding protein